jgi:mRNA interferase MazF
MINFYKYDVVVVKFPFASSLKYKARPAVVLSSEIYNESKRGTVMILAISSKIDTKLDFEFKIDNWRESGLLKPSLFKSSIATIEQSSIITKLGTLSKKDMIVLDKILTIIC